MPANHDVMGNIASTFTALRTPTTHALGEVAQRRAAIRLLATRAHDAADFLALCDALDLDPREGR